MSDLWPFSSSSPPPNVHHSSLPQSSPFASSPPPLSSPRNHGNLSNAKVPPYHLILQTQAFSPHLSEPQVTSPHHPPPPQVTSPHFSHPQGTSPHFSHPQVTSPHFSHPQVTSPHFAPEIQESMPNILYQPQETSPHCASWSQVTSPHIPPTQVTSPHIPPAQVTSPHHIQPQISSSHLLPQAHVTSPDLPYSYVTSPSHLVPQPQATCPDYVDKPQMTSPHLLTSPQYPLSNQNHDPGLAYPNWSRAEQTSEPSCLLKGYTYSYQNLNTSDLDLQLQNENQFSAGVTHHRDELGNTHRLSYNDHTLLYNQADTPSPVQDPWRPQGPTLPQLQCSSLGSMSGEITSERWSSTGFSSSPAEDSSSTLIFQNSCHDSNATQPFCSPSTPGPSPHYPLTPTISSPGPQMLPREERLDYPTQTSRQLSRAKALSICLQEYGPPTSDRAQHHPHQTSQRLLHAKSELIKNQMSLLKATGDSENSFSSLSRGQDVGSTASSPGLSAGLSWREERGGAGGGGDTQPDWTSVKQPRVKNNTEAADRRLTCMVCQRDFKSLSALNGHMRSHGGFRAATRLQKGQDPRPLASTSTSMVMPVSVPVQSRGTATACGRPQRSCSRLSPATGGAVLHRSLMHLEAEEAFKRSGGDGEDGRAAAHYTPPPMLWPLRAGPGLYCSLTTKRNQRAQTVQPHNTRNKVINDVAMETASPPGPTMTGTKKPRINEGRGFQAVIPPLQDQKYAHSDSHKALLLWMPWDKLECPENQRRVEALLMMARSSVMPGGGASQDLALHVLSESRGDFLLTVEKLLSTSENNSNKRTAQCPSVSWSSAERKLLVKSLQLYQKDFSRIQKAVQTKSLHQCVEFYYLWKKKLSLRARIPAGLTVTLPDSNGQKSSKTS